ncbi:VIR protein [Plasmodium vivax]|uniref:VIR protein n=1 Tax=Plasmodium vivax TaxID=5855 RepID=A0A1G4EDP1_PLAVI|nr:VIR protein [Plasmodium vivax]
MSWLFGRSNRPRNPYNNYNDGSCLNKYHIIKNDIEQQIDSFNKYNGINVHREWDKLYKHIKTKDQELKKCYENGHISARLDNEEIIKNFKKKCNRDRTCNNQATPSTKTPIINPSAQKTCKYRDGCKNETPASVHVKSKLVSGATDSKSAERKDPHEQSTNEAEGQKSGQESIVPQAQTITMPSGSSVETHDEASQEIVNHHSTTSGVEETQEQQLKDSSPSGIRELESSAGNTSSECVPGKDSNLTCISTGEFLDTKGVQTNQHSDSPIDTKHSESQDSVGKNVAGVSGDDKGVTTDAVHNLSPIESTPGFVQRPHEDSHPTTTDRGSTGAVALDRENTGSEEVSSASLASAPSRDVGNNGVTYVAISNAFKGPDGEIKSDKVSHNHTHGSEVLCIEGTCNEAPNTEITSDNNNDILGKLSHVFEVIQENKDNMIKASAPMGIVLLLGLLFKYTSLWRILTKKKRKEPVDMNEELHSVLQEPSIMDDERSIPFSYGAFEYSTFDQNVY